MATTPADTPSSPSHYADVAVQQMDIQAPMADLQGAFDSAAAVIAPRQANTETLIQSPQGFATGGFDIIDGFHGGAGDGWPNDVEPVVAGP